MIIQGETNKNPPTDTHTALDESNEDSSTAVERRVETVSELITHTHTHTQCLIGAEKPSRTLPEFPQTEKERAERSSTAVC